MASEIVPSDPAETPSQESQSKRQPVSLEQIVDAWSKAERSATVGAINCGGLVHRYLVQSLAGVADRQKRREARAVALREISECLMQAGYPAANVRRVLLAYHVARLFGPAVAKQLPLTTVAVFGRLLRHESSERWTLRPNLVDPAQSLWQRAFDEHLTAQQVTAAVDRLLGRKMRTGKVRPDRIAAVIRRLSRLGPAREVYSRLGAVADRDAASAFVAGILERGDEELLALLQAMIAAPRRAAA